MPQGRLGGASLLAARYLCGHLYRYTGIGPMPDRPRKPDVPSICPVCKARRELANTKRHAAAVIQCGGYLVRTAVPYQTYHPEWSLEYDECLRAALGTMTRNDAEAILACAEGD